MLKKYIGPNGPVDVVIMGQFIGQVAPGEYIAVPDNLANQVAWGDVWEDTSPEKDEK